MNLLEIIAKEHSRKQCDRIVRYVGKDPGRFAMLVSIFLTGPYRITQRAAWPLAYCVEKYPVLIKPHLKKIILNLKKNDLPIAVKRNTVRLLQFIPLSKSLRGQVAEICFTFFSDPGEPIAIKVFSMTVLAGIARDEPELKRELKMLIEDQLPFGSAAFLSRARTVLRQLD
jgi:hypothetical protein